MNEKVTLLVSKEVMTRAQDIARRSERDLEEVLAEWLSHFVNTLPIEALSDDEILWLCDFDLNPIQQNELRELLYMHRERELTPRESIRLDELLQFHRRALLRQARATEVAIARGLKKRSDQNLSENYAPR